MKNTPHATPIAAGSWEMVGPARRPLEMLEPRQCRAGRALLGWSRARLAAESGVPAPTLEKYERGLSEPMLRTVARLRRAMERAGVTFLDGTKDHGPGVMLAAPSESPPGERR